jgi:hypothetical protein
MANANRVSCHEQDNEMVLASNATRRYWRARQRGSSREQGNEAVLVSKATRPAWQPKTWIVHWNEISQGASRCAAALFMLSAIKYHHSLCPARGCSADQTPEKRLLVICGEGLRSCDVKPKIINSGSTMLIQSSRLVMPGSRVPSISTWKWLTAALPNSLDG